ncbi:MAG: hypothetical protein V1851_02065 [Patescibacteria group bacterium]
MLEKLKSSLIMVVGAVVDSLILIGFLYLIFYPIFDDKFFLLILSLFLGMSFILFCRMKNIFLIIERGWKFEFDDIVLWKTSALFFEYLMILS